MDLEDLSSSQTEILREKLGLSNNYISLLNNELDDYILYDKNTDKVFLLRHLISKNLLNLNIPIKNGLASMTLLNIF